MTRLLEIRHLVLDRDVYQRVKLNPDVVDGYADAMKCGDVFPPVVAFHDGTVYWLADGFHRVNAARLAGRCMILADVQQGTRRDAIFFACGANKEHDLGVRPRTLSDRKHNVRMVLALEEYRTAPLAKIAKVCRVTPDLVKAVRREGGAV